LVYNTKNNVSSINVGGFSNGIYVMKIGVRAGVQIEKIEVLN